MHSTSGAWKEYNFQPRWRCCCERIWLARASGHWNACSRIGWPAILRPMSRMMRPRRVRKMRNCRRWPVELLGVGIAPRHHRSVFGDAQIGLPQPHPMLAGHAVEALDRRVQQLGVGRKSDGLGLHGGVDRDAGQVLSPQRAALMRYPQALGQQKLQLVAEPLAPMAEVRALVRKLVPEGLFAGERLELRVMDPALAHALVGKPINVLEQQKPNHKAGRYPGPALVAVERRDLAIDPIPVDLADELHHLVLHVDDLIEPGPEKIA